MEIQEYTNYLIYEDGRVYNKKYKRYLKPFINRDGYMNVYLYIAGKRKKISIHRLVAIHYIPNTNNYPEVDHINRIRHDNRLENLRWVDKNIQMTNKGVYKNNKSGVKRISYNKRDKVWYYQNRKSNAKMIPFKQKTHAIWFKFAHEVNLI